jgi:predicted transcriptional regulator
MTITIRPDTESRLRAKADDLGMDIDTIADQLLSSALDWEALDRKEAIEGIRRGLEDSDAGRVRSADVVFAGIRAKVAA